MVTATVTSVISGTKVPKDLQGIEGLETGFKPVPIHQARIVITGQPGSGKSTLPNSDPNILMLDPEKGGKTVADPKAMRFTPGSGVDQKDLDLAYLSFVDKIITRKRSGKQDIKLIAVDTIDKLIDIFQTALTLRGEVEDIGDYGGGHGKGYSIVRKTIWDMLDRIHKAGMGWILIAHTATKIVTTDQNVQRQTSGLAVSPSYVRSIWSDCEHMLFFEHGIQSVKSEPTTKIVGGKRVKQNQKVIHQPVRKLRTSPGGLWQGGNTNDVKVRIPLPSEIVIPEIGGFKVLTEAYNDAVKKLIERRN